MMRAFVAALTSYLDVRYGWRPQRMTVQTANDLHDRSDTLDLICDVIDSALNLEQTTPPRAGGSDGKD